jgi:exodeoxyribonuclease V alpha subunit
MSTEMNYPQWYLHGVENGWIRSNIRELVRFLAEEYGELNNNELLVTVFTSLFQEAGHVTLPLYKSPAEWGTILGLEEESIKRLQSSVLPEISELFLKSKITGNPGETVPYILEVRGGKEFISINRFRRYEERIAEWITEKSSEVTMPAVPTGVRGLLNSLFPDATGTDWQKTAAALSLYKSFLIVSGGPGTGKTTTMARILALHLKIHDGALNIALAAPTGKAAGRMGEALRNELSSLNLTEKERHGIPGEAKTIHRLLQGTEERGLLPAAAKKKLHYDLVIVDEASMVDLTLMYRLVTALDNNTRLILLGDRDQLASVEAGSVFADLCRKRENGFSKELIGKLSEIGIEGLPESGPSNWSDDATVYLTKSYRFDEKSGIGRLSALVRDDRLHKDITSQKLRELMQQADDLSYEEFSFTAENLKQLAGGLIERVQNAQSTRNPEDLIASWKENALLTCHRRGPEGSERLNAYTEQMLAASGTVRMNGGWYHGRPVMITRNDYSMGLFNGDSGVCMSDPDNPGRFIVWIETTGGLKPIQTGRLMHVVPAYFLTVHKSQGSEFNSVSLLLPTKESPVLTRELIYTAITRARNEFHLLGSMDLFLQGMKQKTERFTLLGEG